MNWKNILIGFGTVVVFSFLYSLGAFDSLVNQVYDYFLHFRVDRERSSSVVFLDVDDPAVVYTGEFPWPRSVTADSLLRLKEYGAKTAIFDIEYIDKGPQGVDSIYLNNGLSADFNNSFSEIKTDANDLFQAMKFGRLGSSDVAEYTKDFINSIDTSQHDLFNKAKSIARDNDLYLIQSSALFGRSWATLNLRKTPLEGEQAERRPIAEQRFSYPVAAVPHTDGGTFIDVLPPIQGFAKAAEGAGFTNVEVDKDGIRRRIRLAQNIQGHWYLQLAFAPLVNYLGNPEIDLNNNRLLMKGAKMPGGGVKDINIPLDGEARMMLDWPKEDYTGSYVHFSFEKFSRMEDLEAGLQRFSIAFSGADIDFFAQFDDSLKRIPIIIGNLREKFDQIRDLKTAALENCSDESFNNYVAYRSQSRDLIRELLDIDPGTKINALVPELTREYPENAEGIRNNAEYITNQAENLKMVLDNYEELNKEIGNGVKDKFCILGRSDTGTTDIGTNPFYGEYVNVGTHGVILDMILSGIFINFIGKPWRVLFALVFLMLFFIASAKIPPVPRAVTGFLVTVLVIVASALLFRYTGIYFSPVLTVFSMITAVILREIISYAGSEQEKQFIRKAFSTYVSDDVVKEIITDPSRLQLGGTKRHMSALFTDIQGFSTIAEQLDPENLVSLLNRYLTVMSDAVLAEKGTIDKYEGDAIIAFFGAPMPLEDHAIRVCNSAIAMKRIEEELNKKVIEEKLSPEPLLTRVGINTGSMVAGNMGTGKKMDYTIMGNAVNLAARLEGVNKQYGTWVIASDDTIKETEGRFLTRKLDLVRVVGINEPVRLHELIETMEGAAPEQKKMVEVFHQALELFEKRNWRDAAKGFKEAHSIRKDHPSIKYFERCKAFLTEPPKDEWDGIYNLMEK